MKILLGLFGGSLGLLIDPETEKPGVPVKNEQDEPFTDQIYITAKTVKIFFSSFIVEIN